jgi:hypothetical protein
MNEITIMCLNQQFIYVLCDFFYSVMSRMKEDLVAFKKKIVTPAPCEGGLVSILRNRLSGRYTVLL